MTKLRTRLALALCALAPFAFSGCAGDDSAHSSQGSAVASPAPRAASLDEALVDLSARIRTADAALAAVVADSVTSPDDRLAALDKALAGLRGDTASGLGEDLRSSLTEVIAGWDASVEAQTDPALRKVAETGRDDAKARAAKLTEALRGADAAVLYHGRLLREIRAAIGAQPTSAQIIAARKPASRVTAAGKKATDWLAYASVITNKAGKTPLPAATAADAAEPKVEAPEVPTEPAPVPPAAEPEPVKTAPEPVKPAAEPAKPAAEAPKPAAEPAKPTEPATAEPQPVAEADPVPEPKE